MKRLLLLSCTTLLLTGCLPPSLFQSEMPVTASMSDSGGTAVLIPYQPLVVRLQTNPSTGYGWTYTVTGDDVLRLDTVTGEAPAANGMVGVPGDQVWSFRAQGVGRAVLTYVYARSWEKNAVPAKTFTLTVEVNPAQ
jgi:inhibitor of cysteine peptidase